MTDQLTIKNHFVPQSYLKRWENSDQKVFAYKTLVSHSTVPYWKKYSVAAIAYHKHLYTQVLNGQITDDLEKWFSHEFETPANSALEKATHDQKLSEADWNILIRFLAAQDVRTPARMLDHLKRAPEMFSTELQRVLDELKDKIENRDLASLKSDKISALNATFPLKVLTELHGDDDTAILRAEGYIGRSSWIYTIRYLLENTAKVLHTHKWSIIKPAKGYYWITSDNPVVKVNYTDENNYDFGGGWGRLKGNIIFPISPEHAMFVQIGDKPIIKGSRFTVLETRLINKLIAENSHRIIFSKNEDSEVISLKKRTVNKEMLINENAEFLAWAEKNAEMEREYFFKNQPEI